MRSDNERVTLVVCDATKPDLDWVSTRTSSERIVFLDSIAVLQFGMGSAFHHLGLDVERVVIDRAGTSDQYLDLLARVPAEFVGDLVMIRPDGSGFLSAAARGGDRVLYAITERDLRFYLETHDLVTGQMPLEMTA